MSDESMVITAADYERRFFAEAFAGAAIVTVEMRILQETYDEILAVAQQEGWEPQEALRILLIRGLGYTKGQLSLHGGDERQDRLLDQLVHLESATAVMRFYAFDFMQDNKILEMRNSALRSMIADLERTIGHLRSENDALRAEIERLKAHDGGIPAQGVPNATEQAHGGAWSIRTPFRRRRKG